MKKIKVNLTDLINKVAGTKGKILAFSNELALGTSQITDTHIILGKNELLSLEVTGEGMEPTLLEGDIIYVDKEIIPRPNAKDIAVLKVNGEYHVTRFTVYGSQLLLIHENAPIKVVRLEDVEVIGKVVKVAFEPEMKESHSAVNTVAL